AAALTPGQRRPADGFIQVRAAVLEEEVRPHQEPGGGYLRTLEEGEAGGVVEDGRGVRGNGSLSGVRAAHGATALLEEHEAGGMGAGRRAEADEQCGERPDECGEDAVHRVPPLSPPGAPAPRRQRSTRLYVSTSSTKAVKPVYFQSCSTRAKNSMEASTRRYGVSSRTTIPRLTRSCGPIAPCARALRSAPRTCSRSWPASVSVNAVRPRARPGPPHPPPISPTPLPPPHPP